jgi:microcystin-dependent protein
MEGFLAEIRLFPERYAPKYWAFCDGGKLPIDRNQALYSLLGTTYGGDGVREFALPRLANVRPGVRYIICIVGGYPTPESRRR